MALDAELINLKSAGTYRFERDKSEISNDVTTISNTRLVVGFSKMGPFNTVKLVTSPAQFIKLYGNIDRSLEKRGSFFHRSALVALSTGPVLCLNLLNLDPDLDQVVEKTFSISSGDTNRLSAKLPLQSLYNSDKFWFPSDEAFLDGVEKCLGDEWAEGILHFSNVGKKPLSILIKKASDFSSKGYQLTLNEWYGEGNVPEYLNGTSYVSDYLVEVYVVTGDFGPALDEVKNESYLDLDGDGDYENLPKYKIHVDPVTEEELPYKRFASDIVYQSFYDERGFIRGEGDSNLAKFLNLPSVDLRAKYVGSLIPNFIDKLGRNIWIEKLVNDDTDTIGLICSENVAKLEDVNLEHDFVEEKIDLIGHNVGKKLIERNLENGAFNSNLNIPDMNFDFLSYKFNYTDKQQQIKIAVKNGDVIEYPIYMRDPEKDDLDNVATEYRFAWVNTENSDEDNSDVVYSTTSYLKVGSKVYKKVEEEEAPVVDNSPRLLSAPGDSEPEVSYDAYSVIEIEEDVKPLVTEFVALPSDDLFTDPKNENAYIPRDNEVILEIGSDVVVGDYLLSGKYSDEDGFHTRVTRVVEVRNIYDNNAIVDANGKVLKAADKFGILVICADRIEKAVRDINDGLVIKVTPIDKLADRFQWICLNGFQMRKDGMPNGTNEKQNEILDMLREYPEFPSTKSNLFKALIDRDFVQWRYLVDTFGLGIEPECKKVYTQLCQARKSAFAIVNCPSQLDFKKHVDPWFTNETGGVEVEYISKGGDLSRNPSFLFTLPKIENGASWGAYYYPYLRIADLGAAKSVPPAAYVSNLFIQKYNRGFAWSIVAGQKRGVISGNQVVGVEATLGSENRDWLEPMGINAIIWEQGVGVEVYANKTAKQTPVSALSSIHVREAAIYIQDNVESILRRYIFEFNTAQTRMEIKTLVDEFLENMKNNGGLYDYRTVMDTSNNTPEVIDNNKGVIDIYVEVVRGLEMIAQRLTILKTGAIQAGGFED